VGMYPSVSRASISDCRVVDAGQARETLNSIIIAELEIGE